ncbi:MAG: SGNH/GDSL hydrolase family protein [Candidatus Rokubacteria bacterium]|nr:SGNH/GDSL hydrolase family protein [Candidatus Rokubacteria bacterium]MBI3824665.1 SGNH/GDSL hydrolase family protein [Candidatus Rokubacteria bacterium]
MTPIQPGWRRWLVRGLVSLVSLAVVLLGLEGLLRSRPTLLGDGFANGALSRYTARAGGIYYSDRQLRMHFMIPDLTTTMYANGYVWQHGTDALGFRNRPLHVPAEVMLLGDSIVYGQGVEFPDTLGAQLERLSGRTVANLGRQGDCAYQEAYLLTAFVDVFKPRWVFYVFSPNDIVDLYVYLSDQAMRDFVAQPVAAITYPARVEPAKALAERERRLRRRPLLQKIEDGSYVMKMFRWLASEVRKRRATSFQQAAITLNAPRRQADAVDVSHDPGSLGWRYTAHAIAYMHLVASRAGARLVAVSLGDRAQSDLVRASAARAGVAYLDAREVVEAGDSWLPRDGHLSPAGARHLATLAADFIARDPSATR